MEANIMLYHDSTDILGRLTPFLWVEKIDMTVVQDRDELFSHLRNHSMQLLLFDVEFGGLDWYNGVEMLADIRKCSNICIIVVSAQKMESAKIMALNAGADDYVTADCNTLELLARIKSQLRRYDQLAHMKQIVGHIYTVDGLEVNDLYRCVRVDGREVKLTPSEYEILKLLVQEKGKAISGRRIYETIWHMQAYGVDNTIAVHIRHIREKIERDPKNPRYLKAVWGTGYKVG